MRLHATTSQTVGPYFRIGFERLITTDIAGAGVQGRRVTITGRVVDGEGVAVPDAVIEVWQANAAGRYAHPEDTQDKPLEPGFLGFGRVATDDDGGFRFTTVKPGCVPGPDERMQSPHLVIGILMRGLMKGLSTRAYFPGEESLACDPILELVEPSRRDTLILKTSQQKPDEFYWEIRVQGESETVFFDI